MRFVHIVTYDTGDIWRIEYNGGMSVTRIVGGEPIEVAPDSIPLFLMQACLHLRRLYRDSLFMGAGTGSGGNKAPCAGVPGGSS